MTPQEAIFAVERGRLVVCTKEEYPDVRNALQDQAGKWIDAGDMARMLIAISEIRRLDRELAFHLF